MLPSFKLSNIYSFHLTELCSGFEELSIFKLPSEQLFKKFFFVQYSDFFNFPDSADETQIVQNRWQLHWKLSDVTSRLNSRQIAGSSSNEGDKIFMLPEDCYYPIFRKKKLRIFDKIWGPSTKGPFFPNIHSFSDGTPRDCFFLNFWGRNLNAYFIKKKQFFFFHQGRIRSGSFSQENWVRKVSIPFLHWKLESQKKSENVFKMEWSRFSNTFFSGTIELTSTFKVSKNSYLWWNFHRPLFTWCQSTPF